MSTTVNRQHKRVDHREKASVLALGRGGAACSAVEQLSFGCRRCAAFQIDGIEVESRALSVVVRIWRQKAVPSA